MSAVSRHAELEIPPGLSLVWGDNGSGEDFDPGGHLSFGSGPIVSHRNTERLIRRGQDHLRVIGQIGTEPLIGR